MGKIILGSSSPRRADILNSMKLDFEIIPSNYVEKHDKTVFSYEFVEELAYNKALDVAKKLHDKNEEGLVIGADTIVVVDNKILGKPKDYDEAYKMLSSLSGREHFVVTAVCVINSKNLESRTLSDTTYVTFEDLTDFQIRDYIEKYKPFDKAGAYGIQELPDGYVKCVKGDIDNVIGLPSRVVKLLIEQIG